MADEHAKDIDAMIENALGGEPLRAAMRIRSSTRRCKERGAALLDHEHARFRYAMATLGVAFLAALFTFGMGCAGTSSPPPDRAEVQASKPHPKAVWMQGQWAWKGRKVGYVWVPGHWRVPPPRK